MLPCSHSTNLYDKMLINCNITASNDYRDSTGTGTGTVPARNSVVPVRSRNIFCSGAGPCKAFSLDLLPTESIKLCKHLNDFRLT